MKYAVFTLQNGEAHAIVEKTQMKKCALALVLFVSGTGVSDLALAQDAAAQQASTSICAFAGVPPADLKYKVVKKYCLKAHTAAWLSYSHSLLKR